MSSSSSTPRKVILSAYRMFNRTGWVMLLAYLSGVTLLPTGDRGSSVWIYGLSFLGAAGLVRTIDEYQHPQPLDPRTLLHRSVFLKRLITALIIFTLGPWLFFKWNHLPAELPWLALLWGAAALVGLLRSTVRTRK